MIIALTGHMQNGKSTVCDLLAKDYGYTVVGFADALKSMALAIDPLIPVPGVDHRDRPSYVRMSLVHGWSGWEGVKRIPEGRRFLQRLGTEGVREHLGKDAWVNAWQLRAREASRARGTNFLDNVAVPDCRFLSEEARVRELGGKVWRVIRTGHVDPNAGAHASELEQDLIQADETLEASSREELEALVHNLMRQR